MNKTDFFSSNSYIFLPTIKNPKVALAVDSPILVENAFKLYNPFSKKAKFLKNIAEFVFRYFNGVSKTIWGEKKVEKSTFVSYLEVKMGRPLVSSIYFSTIKDKVVIQLQNSDVEIIGYLKYPLNEVGLLHLENEKNALEILSEKKVVHRYLLDDEFDGKPFLLLAPLDGDIGLVERNYIDELLLRFKQEEVYSLSNHPRIEELKKSVETNDMSKYLFLIEKICQHSVMEYALVYEHGDFTPWNIVKVNGEYIPFDFEYFVENGLEYFDLIKYYYQVGKLLEKMGDNELILYIKKQINIPESLELLQLFLIKEIIRCKEEGENFEFESEMLCILEGL